MKRLGYNSVVTLCLQLSNIYVKTVLFISSVSLLLFTQFSSFCYAQTHAGTHAHTHHSISFPLHQHKEAMNYEIEVRDEDKHLKRKKRR